MKRWRRTAAAVTLGVVGTAGLAQAASNDLPKAIREASTIDPSQQAAIGKFVQDMVGRVAARDKNSSSARDDLTRQAETNPAVTPSAAFLSAYLRAVDDNIAPLFADKTDKGTLSRLNGAIIVAKLTRSTKLPQLQGKAAQLMVDASPAVAIWGVKSGEVMLPNLLELPNMRVNQGAKLIAAIVAGGKAHLRTGPVVSSAYEALYLQPPVSVPAIDSCIDGVIELLAARTNEYVTGVPDMPQAERVPCGFLSSASVRGLTDKKPAQKLAVVQNLLNLLSVTAQHIPNLPQPNDEKSQQVIQTMSISAGALYVIFRTDQPTLANQFQAIAGSVRAKPDWAKVLDQVNAAHSAVQALPAYKAIKDAPKIQGAS